MHGFQEHVRSALAAQAKTIDIDTIERPSKSTVRPPTRRISAQR
jgi:hypothetical protein